MTISYKWLSEYLPEEIEPQKLSKILTSIGLEVESLEQFESIKGGLQGVVTGLVLECTQHPNADKLKLTKIDIGAAEPLKIVCGAANVAVGQKVLVATIGTTIYPVSGQPITINAAKIRGEESQGMICAEDEIGLGTSHEGILVLPAEVPVGTKAADYFKPYTDHIYEIGLTPNRMDAMSHLGVAKDVCAYLTHHNKQEVKPRSPFTNTFKADNHSLPIKVTIENTEACKRYSGVTISGVIVKESPKWLQDKLVAIGQRPINNIVDITNFILHETGQPLHAFDASAIKGGAIIVKNLPQDSTFVTLDEKERKLDSTDLMICNAEEGMCIAGVFGGAKSGVQNETKNIFLESAWFNPISIRKTSFRHGLRTEAAARFEKGVDISNVVNALKRAALLIKQVAGGEISSDIIDIYPSPQEKTQVGIKYHYLKKLSGKNYHPDAIKRILTSLGFEIIKEGMDELWVAVPFSKPDISLPADIVEEILRIDGLDNVEITGHMTISPAADENILKENLREKIAGYLVGLGFNEIVTNSITNSKYYNENELSGSAKMINSLSVDLDVMRLSMVETGLETITYNLNRKNKDLQLFEFGKTYHSSGVGNYKEDEHLALYLTGLQQPDGWKSKQINIDFYRAKGIATGIVQLCGLESPHFTKSSANGFSLALSGTVNNRQVVTVGEIDAEKLKVFDIKQPVFFIDFNWLLLLELVSKEKITYKEVSKFPAVQRDLAIVVNRNVTFDAVENTVEKVKIPKLQQVQLFDIFESEKLGHEKKSMAVSFTFLDEEKTLTDKEIDGMMNRLIQSFETELSAEIRK
ncbi:MAG: phenylalanyl-tRNA synthetase beta chain [Segetibacter sp.]|nr:phenylalanyl-tRNA synthetase beta chain [Segetibacter sp.]